jgi:DNA repair protein SbcC/Rad50
VPGRSAARAVLADVLTRIQITDYQSLQQAEFPLGRFTVITGPSGSGKSAVVRALRLLAFNLRGTSYIRTGAKSAKVVVSGEEWVAGIVRCTGRGRDAYRLAAGTEEPQTYTKLAGGVPDDVVKAVQLSELNFSGQFGLPYLLGEASTGIARTLGELTNVSMVFRAAGEAGRRRKELARDLKLAQERRDGLTEEASRYADVAARYEAVIEAQALAETAQHKAVKVQRLRLLAERLRAAQASVALADADMASRELPSLDGIEAKQARLSRLRTLAAEHARAASDCMVYRERVRASAQAEQTAHEAVHAALVAAGQCPTCGQEVR